jgi:pimeloyl-ACP methyl ester carboxylesterase
VPEPQATVICVHGGLDRGGSFSRLARRLERFDVIAYDRRGYQGSRDVQPLSFDHGVDDLCALVEHESKRQPVIAFGHSYGGLIIFGAALREGSPIRALVNYESPVPWIIQRNRTRPSLAEDGKAEAEVFFKRMVSQAAWDRLSEMERESRRLDGAALLADLRTLRGDEPFFDISQLRLPAAYVYGDSESADYYGELARGIKRLNPTIETIEITRAGHAAHLRNPEQIAAIIQQMWDAACASA